MREPEEGYGVFCRIVLSFRCGPGAVRYVAGDNTIWSMEKPSSLV